MTRCCTFVDQQRDVLFYLPLKEGQSYAKACNLKIKKAAKKGNRVLEDYFVKEIDQDKFMVGTGNIRIIKKSNGGIDTVDICQICHVEFHTKAYKPAHISEVI